MKEKIEIYIFIFCFCILTGCAEDNLQYVETENGIYEVSDEDATKDEIVSYDTITVHVCGEVYFPGVYTVYRGSRIYEVVKQAGGFTALADTEAVNQAKEVSDEEQVYIPSIYEKDEDSDGQGRINLNKADEEELCKIPGIGSTRAKQILDYRMKHGNFQKIEDIMNVTGIKEGIFEKIAPYITVSLIGR